MEQVLERLQQLPEALQQQALQYLEGFVARHTKADATNPMSRKDLFGIWQGQIWMADDFDAPLDDMQEYM
jgi:Protein of unknown function (DUF2281)